MVAYVVDILERFILESCSDTAGLRDSTDPIEQEGVKRALKKYVSLASSRICSYKGPLHVAPIELSQQI